MKKLILFLFVGIFLIGLVGAEGNFTPIFCNDYEFTCCGGMVEPTQSQPISDELSWTCPNYAYKCKITMSSGIEGVTWYVGSGNCKIVESGWFGLCHGYKCDNEIQSGSEMNSGDQVYLRRTGGGSCGDIPQKNIQIKIIKPQLGFCGKSGSVGEETTCGISVDGADGCKFNPPSGVIYESTSLNNKKEGLSSYVVPMQQCVLAWQGSDRHICGYKEETCSSDSECSGHTYGNKE